jgi:predicted ABC-type ATPase
MDGIMENPNVIILSGPNGAGKSTISQTLLSGAFGACHYVNADAIARGLSAFYSEGMAVKAAKVMLEHLYDLAAERANFAFETTLGSRTFAPWIAELKQQGYSFHLIYIWVPSAEVSIQRVRDRVKFGGHSVPEDTIRRRYQRGLENFFKLYQPLANSWIMLDNSILGNTRSIAEMKDTIETIHDQELWNSIRQKVLS